MTAAENLSPWKFKDELTLDEACAFLNIARQTMYNRIKDGTAPRRFKENGRWMFRRVDLESYRKNERKFFEVGQ